MVSEMQAMASITVRNLDDDLKQPAADSRGGAWMHSMEQEARDILCQRVLDGPTPTARQ